MDVNKNFKTAHAQGLISVTTVTLRGLPCLENGAHTFEVRLCTTKGTFLVSWDPLLKCLAYKTSNSPSKPCLWTDGELVTVENVLNEKGIFQISQDLSSWKFTKAVLDWYNLSLRA